MRYLLLTHLALLFFGFTVKAQSLDIEVIQQGLEYSDSSFYDIIPVKNEYWIAGKYGVLKSYDQKGHLSNVNYPSEGVDIYKMAYNQKGELLAAGDKGTIYTYNPELSTWSTTVVSGYESSCFYNLSKTSTGTLFISGGNSKIAHSRKAVPQGFILQSDDHGKSWHEVYNNPLRMVWTVQENPFDQSLYALMYTPSKTHLYKMEGGKWTKQEKIGNTIYHFIEWKSKDEYVVTGGWIGKKGRIVYNDSEVVMKKAGLIWSRTANEEYELYPACNGNLVLGTRNGQHLLFHKELNKNFSLYEAIFTGKNEALVIGSARTLLKVKIEDLDI